MNLNTSFFNYILFLSTPNPHYSWVELGWVGLSWVQFTSFRRLWKFQFTILIEEIFIIIETFQKKILSDRILCIMYILTHLIFYYYFKYIIIILLSFVFSTLMFIWSNQSNITNKNLNSSIERQKEREKEKERKRMELKNWKKVHWSNLIIGSSELC